MPDLTDRSEPRLMLDLIMDALRVRDPRLNDLAAEVLTRSGARSVPCLALVATDAKNKPDHRVRALDVLARIGPPYGPELLDLTLLLRARNQSVRAAARRILGYDALAGASGGNVGPVLRT